MEVVPRQVVSSTQRTARLGVIHPESAPQKKTVIVVPTIGDFVDGDISWWYRWLCRLCVVVGGPTRYRGHRRGFDLPDSPRLLGSTVGYLQWALCA